jgi:DNA polymerase-1
MHLSDHKQSTLSESDYAQIEQSFLAVYGGPKSVDPHAAFAAKLFHVPLEKVTPDQRRRAKAIAYSTAYGVTKKGDAL